MACVIVNDACCLIDLRKARLLHAVLSLPHRFVVPYPVRASDPVDPATGTLTLTPGQQKQVTIRMDMEFEGKFTLKAFNPVTMAAYASIDLETDYAV